MQLTIINCSPRIAKNSNTEKLIDSFKLGFEAAGNTTQTYRLSARRSWDEINRAFLGSTDILLAIPLYVECIPGLMIEFLEQLPARGDNAPKARLSFILHGGFSEASQLRCGERYLKLLTEKLGCELGGVLIKGGTFAASMFEGKMRARIVDPFETAGADFARDGGFDEKKAAEFAGEEYMTEKEIKSFKRSMFIDKLIFDFVGKRLGSRKPLGYPVYKDEIE